MLPAFKSAKGIQELQVEMESPSIMKLGECHIPKKLIQLVIDLARD